MTKLFLAKYADKGKNGEVKGELASDAQNLKK
jgi:hypothetical protein